MADKMAERKEAKHAIKEDAKMEAKDGTTSDLPSDLPPSLSVAVGSSERSAWVTSRPFVGPLIVESQSRPGHVRRDLCIRKEGLALIAGTNQRRLKDIEDATGCSIFVLDREGPPPGCGPNERALVLVGSSDGVEFATLMLYDADAAGSDSALNSALILGPLVPEVSSTATEVSSTATEVSSTATEVSSTTTPSADAPQVESVQSLQPLQPVQPLQPLQPLQPVQPVDSSEPSATAKFERAMSLDERAVVGARLEKPSPLALGPAMAPTTAPTLAPSTAPTSRPYAVKPSAQTSIAPSATAAARLVGWSFRT
jgi:hypothetical protein